MKPLHPINTLGKDEEDRLIADACAEKSSAGEELYGYYLGLIRREARQRYLAAPGLQEETEAIASLAFVEAAHDYDSSQGVHFAAFLQSRIKGALYMAFCRTRRYLNRTSHPDQDSSAEKDCWSIYVDAQASQKSHEESVCRRESLRQAMQILSEKEKRLLRLIYWEDMPLKKIAAGLHVSPQYISKQKQRILQKLRDALSEKVIRYAAE